jgi:hypothetical protein
MMASTEGLKPSDVAFCCCPDLKAGATVWIVEANQTRIKFLFNTNDLASQTLPIIEDRGLKPHGLSCIPAPTLRSGQDHQMKMGFNP